jgi:hypothetical protein
MVDNLEESVYGLLDEFRRVTPLLVMRRFKVSGQCAQKLCYKVWNRQALEAREYMKALEM